MTVPAVSVLDLATRLKAATHDLHRQAERSGVIARLLAGSLSRASYVLFLRNLLPAYQSLEAGLEASSDDILVGPFVQRALFRSDAIVADLDVLAGAGWAETVPVLPEATAYARDIGDAAAANRVLLIAHAYIRFLGDLNGGRILARKVAHALGLAGPGLNFYAYPEGCEISSGARRYRSHFERHDLPDALCTAMEDEARRGFKSNIAVSEAVARFRE